MILLCACKYSYNNISGLKFREESFILAIYV